MNPRDPGQPPERPDAYAPLVAFQRWVIAGFAIALIPSALAAIGGVALSGGQAIHGLLSFIVDAVLVISLVAGLSVLGVGFVKFLAAQAAARSWGAQTKPGGDRMNSHPPGRDPARRP